MSKKEIIGEILMATGMNDVESGRKIVDAMFGKALKPLLGDEAYKAVLDTIMVDVYANMELQSQIALEAIDHYLLESELEEVLAFYKSKVGSMWIEKSKVFAREIMIKMQEEVGKRIQAQFEEMMKEMTDEGGDFDLGLPENFDVGGDDE